MTSSMGPVVNWENTVNGNPPYMRKTKNPNASCVASPYPAMRTSAMVSKPVNTLPKTQQPLAPILAKTCGVIIVEGITSRATQTDSHWYPVMVRIGSSPALVKLKLYCSNARGDRHIGKSAVEPKLSAKAPSMMFHMTLLLIVSGRVNSSTSCKPPCSSSLISRASPGSMKNRTMVKHETIIKAVPTHNGANNPELFIKMAIIPPPAFPNTKCPTSIPNCFSFSILLV
mmetsp:Transcript_24578/g.58115  ORF Transcript_24578/g.58115 Transcript_24578/m.58115 type:complete len:228 (-) Transcript_24578:572-1255(-)